MIDIYEPMYCPEKLAFCTKNPIIKPLLQELYDITKETEPDRNKEWKVQVADYLNSSNKNLPMISNLGIRTTLRNLQERAQQTKFTMFKQFNVHKGLDGGSMATLKSQFTGGSSVHISTSSCVSCSDFGSTDDRIRHIHRKEPLTDLIKKKTAPLTSSSAAALEIEKEEQDESKTRKLFRDVQMDVMKQANVIRQMLTMDGSKEVVVREGEVIEQELIEEEVIKGDLHTIEVAKSAHEEVPEKPELQEAVQVVPSDKVITEKPVDEDEQPVVEQPALEDEQPAPEKHADEEPVSVEHAVKQPVGGESAVEEPATKELAAEDEHPVAEEPAAEEPVAAADSDNHPQDAAPQEHAEEAPVEE